ncbi:MAG: 50S ribosomal protein L6 [Holosporales bacterium]|jgi:large subunit ribosomal protein L6|nr:50S ribosomal protein L6 [Holosporales bacterium]
MSRVGKHKIDIPAGISVAIDGNTLNIKKGELEQAYEVPQCIVVNVSNDSISFAPTNGEKSTRALWGTSQRNVGNIIRGLSDGFKVELEMVGVGYRAAVTEKKLVMQLGFSHDVEYNIPDDISIACPKPTVMVISGYSKKRVGDVAALLKKYRKPEPYKGRGIMKSGEFVYRKDGKRR